MSANNNSLLQSFRQFLDTYQTGPTAVHVPEVSTVQVPDLTSDHMQTVVLRSRTTTDSCLFSDHTISPNDVEPEVFDWIFYHLDYKKCPYPLAFALASIVARKLGLAATASESHTCEADKSKPAISSTELYNQSLEYLTDYINSWKQNPEIAVEIANEYSSQHFHSSIAAIKNTRRKMEDRHVVLHDLNKALSLQSAHQYSYYAIFDGHAGVDAASYASAHLHYNLVKSQAFIDGDIPSAFKDAFSITDLHYLERSAREGKKSGSTALCAIIEDSAKLFVAWLGDSQAVLVRDGKPIDIMVPHKPELEEERKRIEELGGFVAYVDTWRVNGTLAVSRAIGDPEHKPYISSEPDVVQLAIDSDTDFLILACDGLWDNLTPEEATSLVFDYIHKNSDQDIEQLSQNVALYLSKAAKDDGSSDNITTIVIFFKSLDQLKQVSYTPLTPREKNESNGLNGNHFQFNELEFLQSAKNPFDSFEQSQNWNSESFNQMNNAKYNFEISDSTTGSEADSASDLKLDSNANPNPFATNDYSFADLNNQNKIFDSSVNTYFNNESSLLRDESNPKLESDISQTTDNCSNAELQSLQSDSQFNISKVSDISSSFGTQAVTETDHALCSTPLQMNLPSNQTEVSTEQFSINSMPNESLLILPNDQPMEAQSTQDVRSPIMTTNVNDNKDLIDNPFNESTVDSSFVSAKTNLEDSITFEKSGYQTAFEHDLASDLNESQELASPVQSPLKLDEVCEKVFADFEEPFNLSTDNHDVSSGAESVDSFDYKKISSDMSAITKQVESDFSMQQTYGSQSMASEQLAEEKEPAPQLESAQELNLTGIINNAEIAEEPALNSCAEAVDETQQEKNVSIDNNYVNNNEELNSCNVMTDEFEVKAEEAKQESESNNYSKEFEQKVEDEEQNIEYEGQEEVKKVETIKQDVETNEHEFTNQETEQEVEDIHQIEQESIVNELNDNYVKQNITQDLIEESKEIHDSIEVIGDTVKQIVNDFEPKVNDNIEHFDSQMSEDLKIEESSDRDHQLESEFKHIDEVIKSIESNDDSKEFEFDHQTEDDLDRSFERTESFTFVEGTPLLPSTPLEPCGQALASNDISESIVANKQIIDDLTHVSNQLVASGDTRDDYVEDKPFDTYADQTNESLIMADIVSDLKTEPEPQVLSQFDSSHVINEQILQSQSENVSQPLDIDANGVQEVKKLDMSSSEQNILDIEEEIKVTIPSESIEETKTNGILDSLSFQIESKIEENKEDEKTVQECKEDDMVLPEESKVEFEIRPSSEEIKSSSEEIKPTAEDLKTTSVEEKTTSDVSKKTSPVKAESKLMSKVAATTKRNVGTKPNPLTLRTTAKPAAPKTTTAATNRPTGATTATTKTTATNRTTSAARSAASTVSSTRTVAQTKTMTRTTTTRPATTVATTRAATSTLRTATKAPEIKPKVAATRTQPTVPTSRVTASRTATTKPPPATNGQSSTTRPTSTLSSRTASRPTSSTTSSVAAKKPAPASSTVAARKVGPTSTTMRPTSTVTASKVKTQTTMNGTKGSAGTKTTTPVSRVNTGRTTGTATTKTAVSSAPKVTTASSVSSAASVAPKSSVTSMNANKSKATNEKPSLKQELEDAMSQPVPLLTHNND